jgi:hypothetical protein
MSKSSWRSKSNHPDAKMPAANAGIFMSSGELAL